MIYYFSGTGNSRFVAHEIARLTGDNAYDMTERRTAAAEENENFLGFVFPVYGWQPPMIARRFCTALEAAVARGRFVYVVMTCGDDAGKALNIFNKLMKRQGIAIDSAYTVIMPDVYVCLPGFDVDSDTLRRKKFTQAATRIPDIAAEINSRQKRNDVHEGIFPRTKTYALGALFFRFLVKDTPFAANDNCNGCGICEKGCPVKNITFSNGRPQWKGKCEGCMNCYHSCPKHAIHFGKQTLRKGQYTFRQHTAEMKEIMHHIPNGSKNTQQ